MMSLALLEPFKAVTFQLLEPEEGSGIKHIPPQYTVLFHLQIIVAITLSIIQSACNSALAAHFSSHFSV